MLRISGGQQSFQLRYEFRVGGNMILILKIINVNCNVLLYNMIFFWVLTLVVAYKLKLLYLWVFINLSTLKY